ncbi:hypothetical protein [Streptomyces sp. NPDC003077]|uniref:hypothetical protein n=1 Tax=Streptomyces sp. NPDC003077 TaxID=3154443 RepID=UPI0033B7A3F0
MAGALRAVAAAAMGPLLALAASVGWGLVAAGDAAAVDTGRGRAGFCPDGRGVTVVVDFRELGGRTIVRCAVGRQATGLAALKAAGIRVAGTNRWGEAFVCRLEGKPGPRQEPCVDTPPAKAYWSYWHAPNGGRWTYSQYGATYRTPPQGSFEGWSFSFGRDEGEAPAPRVAPKRPVAAPAPGPAPAPRPTSGEDADSGRGGVGSGGGAVPPVPSDGRTTPSAGSGAAPGPTGDAGGAGDARPGDRDRRPGSAPEEKPTDGNDDGARKTNGMNGTNGTGERGDGRGNDRGKEPATTASPEASAAAPRPVVTPTEAADWTGGEGPGLASAEGQGGIPVGTAVGGAAAAALALAAAGTARRRRRVAGTAGPATPLKRAVPPAPSGDGDRPGSTGRSGTPAPSGHGSPTNPTGAPTPSDPADGPTPTDPAP